MTTITVQDNQAMSDVVIKATGSINASRQFCADNNVCLTDEAVPGTVYAVSDAALAAGDSGVLKYLADNGTVLATRGSDPE